MSPSHTLASRLFYVSLGEEHPYRLFSLFLIWVILMHLAVYFWLEKPEIQSSDKVEPYQVEVTLLGTKGDETHKEALSSKAKPQPSPPPQPTQKPAEASPAQPKADQEANKEKPNAKTGIQHAQPQKTKKAQPTPEQIAQASTPPPQPEAVQRQSQNTKSTLTSKPRISITESSFRADGMQNPAPDYPEMAVFLGYEGTAVIRIYITPKGETESVEVLLSSGHKILDEEAANIFKRWHFKPSKKAHDNIVIPVTFTMHD